MLLKFSVHCSKVLVIVVNKDYSSEEAHGYNQIQRYKNYRYVGSLFAIIFRLTTKKQLPEFSTRGVVCAFCEIVLLSRNILVHVLRAYEGVEEEVCQASNNHPVACEIAARKVNNKVLQQWKDTATANECHEDT